MEIFINSTSYCRRDDIMLVYPFDETLCSSVSEAILTWGKIPASYCDINEGTVYVFNYGESF